MAARQAPPDEQDTQIALFRGKQIRRTLHKDEWWFVVQDVIAALTDSADPRQYVKKLRARDPELSKGWVQLVPTLTIETLGGPQWLGMTSN